MSEFCVALAAASKGKRCVLWFCVVNRARTTWRAPMGFELFMSFLQYFEFHCINSRRRRSASLSSLLNG